MYNIGELVRSKYASNDVYLIGFGSFEGRVIAGSSWGAPMQELNVPEAKKDSWEWLLHQAGAENKVLLMEDLSNTLLAEQRIGHRAIGVVYRPAYEKYGNYVPSLMTRRYDAFVFIDKTRALYPLDITQHTHQMPDTYPFGF